jgi:apolipoprotein N-acyltransferase
MSSKKTYQALQNLWRHNRGDERKERFELFIKGVAAGTLFAAAFPPLGFWPLAFVAFAIIASLLFERLPPFKAGLVMASFSLTANFLGFYWIAYTLTEFAAVPWILSVPLTLLFFVILSSVSFIYGALWGLLRSRLTSSFIVLLAMVLFFAFWDRFDLRLFPWAAHMAVGEDKYLIATAGVLGTWGWRFLFAALSVLVFFAWQSRRKSLALTMICFALLLTFGTLYFVGHQSRERLQKDYAFLQPAAILQGNVGNFEKKTQRGEEPTAQNILKIYGNLVEESAIYYGDRARNTVDASGQVVKGLEPWFFWPETAVPSYPLLERDVQSRLDFWANLSRGLHLIGSYHQGRELFAGKETSLDYNIALLLHESAGFRGFYKKQILMPFGEYFPGDKYIPKVYEWIPAVNHFGRGTSHVLLDHPDPKGVVFVPLICYEVLFDGIVDAFLQRSDENFHQRDVVLYNPTNDSWFGPTSQPYLHARLTQWQAARVQRSLVRATNTGLSMIVAPWGEVLSQGPLFQAAVIYGGVPVTRPQQRLPDRLD